MVCKLSLYNYKTQITTHVVMTFPPQLGFLLFFSFFLLDLPHLIQNPPPLPPPKPYLASPATTAMATYTQSEDMQAVQFHPPKYDVQVERVALPRYLIASGDSKMSDCILTASSIQMMRS